MVTYTFAPRRAFVIFLLVGICLFSGFILGGGIALSQYLHQPAVQATPNGRSCAGLKDAPPAIGNPPAIVFEAGQWKLVLGDKAPILSQTGKLLQLGGYGSMLPVADEGHYLLVLPTTFDKVRLNQFVLFQSPQVGPEHTMFHQVIGRGQDAAGPFFWTRGIANCAPDWYLVRPADLVGVVTGVYWGKE